MESFRRLLPYARPYRAGIALGLVFVAFSNVAGIVMPWLIGRAIDALARPDVTTRLIGAYAGLIVATTTVSGAARFGMRRLLNGISRRVENDLREDLFDHLLRLDAGFYGSMPTGELMSRMTNDTQAVRMAVGPGIMYMVNTLVLGVLAIAVMIGYDLRLTLLALVPLVFLGPVMSYFGRVIHRRFEHIQRHFGVLSTMVQENLSGVRIVRAYTQESAQESEFDELNRQYFDRNMALARTSAMFHPLLALLTGLGVLVVLWFGGLDVMTGRISAGQFVAFFFYLALLIWPMIAIGWVVNLFQRGAASMGRINEVLDAQPAVRDPAEPVEPGEVRGEIEFRDVWFRYPGSTRDVLCGVSFRIPAGATAAIVGPTGSGKSTVVGLMSRRFDPTRGQVLLDGVSLDRIPLEQLRRSIALVPQDAFVFSETIRENIALGLAPGVDRDDRIEAAARVARLDEAISVFPAGSERLTTDAVEAAIGPLFYISGSLDPLPQFVDCSFVPFFCSADEIGVADIQLPPSTFELCRQPIYPVLRVDALLVGSLRYLLTVFVHTDHEVDVIPAEPTVACYAICSDFLECVSQVWFTIRVIDGRSDVELVGHPHYPPFIPAGRRHYRSVSYACPACALYAFACDAYSVLLRRPRPREQSHLRLLRQM